MSALGIDFIALSFLLFGIWISLLIVPTVVAAVVPTGVDAVVPVVLESVLMQF